MKNVLKVVTLLFAGFVVLIIGVAACSPSPAKPAAAPVAPAPAAQAPAQAAAPVAPVAPAPDPKAVLQDKIAADWDTSNWPAAVDDLVVLQKLDPKAMDFADKLYVAHLSWGDSLLTVGNKKDAIAEWKKAAQVSPAAPEARDRLLTNDPAPVQPTPAPTQAPSAPKATPEPPKPAPLAEPGDSVVNGNWTITLNNVRSATTLGSYDPKHASGKYLIATVTAANTGKSTSNLNTWDFQMLNSDGVKFSTDSDGTFAAISDKVKPLSFGQEVQPGLSKQFEVIFDVVPGQNYTLQAAGTKFHVYVG